VETNTLYKGQADPRTAESSRDPQGQRLGFCRVDIMDEDGATKCSVNGRGRRFKRCRSASTCSITTPCGADHQRTRDGAGTDGSLKNIAIGCADGLIGKKMVHDAPDNEHPEAA